MSEASRVESGADSVTNEVENEKRLFADSNDIALVCSGWLARLRETLCSRWELIYGNVRARRPKFHSPLALARACGDRQVPDAILMTQAYWILAI